MSVSCSHGPDKASTWLEISPLYRIFMFFVHYGRKIAPVLYIYPSTIENKITPGHINSIGSHIVSRILTLCSLLLISVFKCHDSSIFMSYDCQCYQNSLSVNISQYYLHTSPLISLTKLVSK